MAKPNLALSPAQISAALQAAYDSAAALLVPLYIPAGTYNYAGGLNFYAAVNVFGDGMSTVLNNVGSGTYGVSICSPSPTKPYVVGRYSMSSMKLIGTSTGEALRYDTQAAFTLRDVHIQNAGGRGIFIAPTQHGYGLTVDNCKIANCGGDGVYGRTRWDKQINAFYFDKTEIAQNNGNGINIWGCTVRIRDCIIQGNTLSGIRLDSSDAITESNNAINITINDNYFEHNLGGAIRVVGGAYTGGVYKLLQALTIDNNYIRGDVPEVVFSRRGDNSDPNAYTSGVVLSMRYGCNLISSTDPSADTIDFDNALSDLCIIHPDSSDSAKFTTADFNDYRLDYYINVGRAKLLGPSRKVLHGKIYGSSSTVVYPDATAKRSNAFTTSATPVVIKFALPLEHSHVIENIAVPFYFGAGTSISVQLKILVDQIGRDDLISALQTVTRTVAGRADGKAAFAATSAPEANTSNVDLYRLNLYRDIFTLEVSVTTAGGSADSTVQIGNPIMRYN